MKKGSRRSLAWLTAVLLLAACTGPAGPKKEKLVLDTTFGVNGIAIAADGASTQGGDYGLALVRHEDGSLLLAGMSCTDHVATCNEDSWAAAAWRFLPGGGLDGGFAHSGTFLADDVAGGKLDLVLDALAVAGDDLLVGSVTTGAGHADGYLWALDPIGAPSAGLLGGAGTAEYDGALAGGGHDLFLAAASAEAGFWIAGASAPDTNAEHYRVTVWKLDLGGNKDPGFDADGVWSSSRSVRSWPHAIAVDAAGRPVLAGVVREAQYTAQVWRLLASGGLDPAFGGGRVALPAPGGGSSYARAVMMDKDLVVIAGVVQGSGGWHPALWRLHADGSLDASFGDGGILVLAEVSSNGGPRYWFAGMQLAKDEKGRYLLAGGVQSAGGDLDAALWRILPNGVEDPDFCDGGPCTLDRAGMDDWATRLVLGPEGSLYLGGWASGPDGDPDAVVWKLRFEAGR